MHTYFDRAARFDYWLAAATSRRLAAAAIAVSAEDAKLLMAAGLPKGKVHLVYNGVSPPEKLGTAERERMRQTCKVPEGGILFGSVGRLTAQKGYDILIQAFSGLVRQHQTARLVLIGEGEERVRLERMVSDLKLQEEVTLLGAHPRARQLIQAADVFVLPSRKEGTSLALCEAMAAGMPAIFTAGGTKELIDRDYPWCLPELSVTALETALYQAATRPELRERAARAMHQLYEQYFTLERQFRQTLVVYNKAMSRKMTR